ncbi:MAG: RtcB family protein [Microcoleaceae cyanobacterium MO_207.B10]|nr:RtcB family protein [Microcoleaceae cyanobacterium MO_207.B10]
MAKNVASLPFVFKHVALMPDVHLGKGAKETMKVIVAVVMAQVD